MSRTLSHFDITLVIFLILCDFVISLFDPLSLGLIAGGASLIYNHKKFTEYTFCQVVECCIDSHIPANIEDLSHDLHANLFGQHIVHDQLISALRSHYTNLDKSLKPLVMSFHGTPGTGKNYVAERIAKHLYKYGVKSKFVKKFMGRTDFPMQSEVNYYQLILRNNITSAIQQCPRSLFIFDEVDKMPVGVFESLTSLLDHHDNVNGLNFRYATFIFLSNAGGTEISEKLVKLMGSGTLREDTKLFDFEKIAEMAAYNVVGTGIFGRIFLYLFSGLSSIGGLRKTSMIEASLIDHFMPFLPLEKRHIEKCIIADFKNNGIFHPTHADIEEISSNYVTYHNNMFSTSGCKRLSKKVSMYADKYRSV